MADLQGQLAALMGNPRVVKIRKSDEEPPCISVIDVVVALTGKSGREAAEVFRRLTCSYPEIEANCSHFQFAGERQKTTPVTSAKGIVEIIMLLPGNQAARVRRQAAELLVRYLGGDITLVDEVCQLREFQNHLAEVEPEDPRRIFGEAVDNSAPEVEAGCINTSAQTRFLEGVRAVVREEMRKNHVWSFSKRSRSHYELMQIGNIVQGDDLRHLDEAEHMVRIVDFLTDRIDPTTWKRHGRKFKNIYTTELKRAKLRESRDEGLPPPVTMNQAEYRIVYTEADYELMVQALEDCRERLQQIAGRDAPLLLQPRRGQRSIVDFMQPCEG